MLIYGKYVQEVHTSKCSDNLKHAQKNSS